MVIKMLDDKIWMKYISAFTFGDGNIRRKGTHAYYRTAQIAEHKDYIQYQAGILEQLTAINLRNYQPKAGRLQIHLETRQHPKYTKVYNRLYTNNKKVIDPHYLKLLDWEFMAIIMMDDGCLVKKYVEKYNRVDYCVVICSECYSYGDNLLFANAAKEKLNLDFDIKPHTSYPSGNLGYRLRLNKKQTLSFCENIKPYIAPSFYYKTDPTIPNRTNGPFVTGDDIVQTVQ